MENRNSKYRSLATYAASMFLVSASNFIIVPLLIHALGNKGFAIWALLEPITLAAIPIAGLGIHLGLMHLGRRSSDQLNNAIASLLIPHAAIAAILAVAVILGVLTIGGGATIALLIGSIVWAEGLLLFFVSVFRSQERPFAFAAVEGGRTIGVLLVVAALAISVPPEIPLVLYLLVRLGAAFLALCLGLRIVNPRWQPSISAAVSAVRYGGPMVAAALMVAVLMSFDRYALYSIGAEPEVTDYTAHSKLAQTIAIATSPFFMWFAPLVMRKISDGKASHPFFINATTAIFVLTAISAGSLWLLAPFMWVWIFPAIQYNALIFGVMALGTAIFVLGNTFSIGTLEAERTHFALIVTGISMTLGIVAAMVMGRFAGPEGVAIGRAIGMAAYTALFAAFTVSSLRVAYPWVKYAVFAVLSAAVAVTLNEFNPVRDLPAALVSLSVFISTSAAIALMVWSDWTRAISHAFRTSSKEHWDGR